MALRTGTNFDDTLVGTIFADDMFGLEGDDTLTVRAGDDTIVGAGDANSMFGGGGDDSYVVFDGDAVPGEVYDGGSGADTLRLAMVKSSSAEFSFFRQRLAVNREDRFRSGDNFVFRLHGHILE